MLDGYSQLQIRGRCFHNKSILSIDLQFLAKKECMMPRPKYEARKDWCNRATTDRTPEGFAANARAAVAFPWHEAQIPVPYQ